MGKKMVRPYRRIVENGERKNLRRLLEPRVPRDDTHWLYQRPLRGTTCKEEDTAQKQCTPVGGTQ